MDCLGLLDEKCFSMRKIAAHRIVLEDGTLLHSEVVVLDDSGRVQKHYPLQGEEPFLEWYPGEIDLRETNGVKCGLSNIRKTEK